VSDAADEERKLRIALMRADIALMRRRAVWVGPLSMVLLATAVSAVVMVTLVAILPDAPPQTINLHLNAPLVMRQGPGK
jgi:hypothetical protein